MTNSLCFVMIATCGAVAGAQAPSLADTNRVLPAFRTYAELHAIGDVTGNGLADIVLPVPGGHGVVWRASVEGVFRPDHTALPKQLDTCRGLVLTDVDGDGDLDCVMANESPGYPQTGVDRIYLNDGNGRFTESPSSPLPGTAGTTTCVASADVDGDGDFDLLLGREPNLTFGYPVAGENLLLLNDGSGTFTSSQGALPADQDVTRTLAFLDHDGDGDQDLFVGSVPPWFSNPFGTSAPARLYRNDGSGGFQHATFGSISWQRTTLEAIARDFDGDGDIDLLTLEEWYGGHRELYLRSNDGSGGLPLAWTVPPSVAGNIEQMLVGDWNADGLTDCAVRHFGIVHPFVMTGSGQFQPSALPATDVGRRMTIAIDYDGDGDTDLIAPPDFPSAPAPITYGLPGMLLRNVGTEWVPLPPDFGASLPGFGRQDLTDANGDGHLDVVRSPTDSDAGRLFVGAGDGTFTEVPTGDFGATMESTSDFASADFDGDGDIDFFCANRQNPQPNPGPTCRLYLQQAGSFQLAPFPALHAEGVAVGDLDGDGDADLVLGTSNGGHILTNDGTGTFQLVANALPAGRLCFPRLADLDGDGDLDIPAYQTANLAETGILLNNGDATFVKRQMSGFIDTPCGKPLPHDFDGDGDVDLFLPGLRESVWV
ncbi:MAG: VCBS repeat-containing protein, partial [Planctomycetes bacterium]|nr:VCBS repeat-containing protein [Planctomycetota bacterium]